MNLKQILEKFETYSMAAAVAEHGEHAFARELLEQGLSEERQSARHESHLTKEHRARPQHGTI